MGHQPSLERYSKTCYFSRQVSFVSKNPLPLGMGSMSTKGTNLPLQVKPAENKGENQLLFAANKWLIGHSESGVDKDGGFIGLIGENTTI